MDQSPEIRIAKLQHGPFPDAPSLNPKFSPHQPFLLATVDIRWDPEAARSAVARLEETLLVFSPDLAKHECRGQGAYRVFTAKRQVSSARPAAGKTGLPTPDPEPYD